MTRDTLPPERDLFRPRRASVENEVEAVGGNDPLYSQPLDHERAIRRAVDQEKQDRRLLREQNVEQFDIEEGGHEDEAAGRSAPRA